MKQLNELKTLQVRVGYQADELSDEGVSLMDIAMWNELGTVNSPSRPFLRQSFDDHETEIRAFAAAQIKKLVAGTATAQDVLQAIGTYQKGLVQATIESGTFEPNAPSTISKKGSDKPLIDTGRMRQSVNYVIQKKGG